MQTANVIDNYLGEPLEPQVPLEHLTLLSTRNGSSLTVSEFEHLNSFSSDPDIIESLYCVRSSMNVYRYLREHLSLFSLLLRARAEIHWIFGPSATPALQIEKDVEGEFEARLLVSIRTSLDARRATALIDALDEQWWLSVDSSNRALMKIDVEYV